MKKTFGILTFTGRTVIKVLNFINMKKLFLILLTLYAVSSFGQDVVNARRYRLQPSAAYPFNNDNALTQVLVWDPTSKEFKWRSAASISTGGAWALTGTSTLTGNSTISGDASTYGVLYNNLASFSVNAATVLNVAIGSSGTTQLSGLSLNFTTNGTGRLDIEDDGAWVLNGSAGSLGQVLTSGGSGATPTWGAIVTSGTSTLTFTGVSNITTTSGYDAHYTRIGDIVTVSGVIEIDPTLTATNTSIGISLPFASNFSSSTQCSGSAAAVDTLNESAGFLSDPTNDRASLQFFSSSDTAVTMSYTFTYRIIP